jgi:hypothetical protein
MLRKSVRLSSVSSLVVLYIITPSLAIAFATTLLLLLI